jgi:putative effector of murein hydrolase
LQQQQQQQSTTIQSSPHPTQEHKPVVPPAKAFSEEWIMRSRSLALASGVAAWLSHYWQITPNTVSTPFVALSMLSATVHNFCFGAGMPKKWIKIFHPLVTCTTLTWVWSFLLGAATGSSFLTMIQGYRRGGALNLATSGAGDFLTFVLGPAVVSLGVSIYERRKLIRQNLKEVVTATGVSCIGGLFGTALAVRLLGLATGELRLSLLPRNITSALAVAIADIVGANKALAVSFAVVTGLIGANFGASLLDFFGIKDPAARGLGIGSAAHGLGTAAFVNEKDAFPFAAIGMTLTAICGTVLVSLPIVKKLALQIALGGL